MKRRSIGLDERIVAGVGGVLGVVGSAAAGYFIGDKICDYTNFNNYIENTIKISSSVGVFAATYQVTALAGALTGVLSWRIFKSKLENIVDKFK
jgi:hypothetical protein